MEKLHNTSGPDIHCSAQIKFLEAVAEPITYFAPFVHKPPTSPKNTQEVIYIYLLLLLLILKWRSSVMSKRIEEFIYSHKVTYYPNSLTD